MEHTKFDSSLGMEDIEDTEPSIAQVFAEVNQVLLHMPRELQILVPRKFMSFLHDNMDTTWGNKLDFSKDLNDMDLLEETRVLLSLVYRDFLCSPEEQEELIKQDKREAILGGWEYEPFSLMELF